MNKLQGLGQVPPFPRPLLIETNAEEALVLELGPARPARAARARTPEAKDGWFLV